MNKSIEILTEAAEEIIELGFHTMLFRESKNWISWAVSGLRSLDPVGALFDREVLADGLCLHPTTELISCVDNNEVIVTALV